MAKQTFTTGQVLTAAQVNSLQANDFNQTVSVKTASYTLVAADKGTRIEFNTSGSVSCTVNTGLFDAGDTVIIQNRGAGDVTVTAGTATVNTAGSLVLSQYQSGTLYFISASASIFFAAAVGDLTAVTSGTGISISNAGGPVPTITNSMATEISAKGDLIVGTGSGTFDNLTVGTNGHTLVADSSTSTGLKWAAPGGSGANWSLLNSGGTALTGADTITISSISGKDKIMVVFNGASANASSLITVRVNGITTGDKYQLFGGYHKTGDPITASNIVGTISGQFAQNYIVIGEMSGNANNNVEGGVTFSGCNSTGLVQFISTGSANTTGNNTGNRAVYAQGYVDTSGSAISSVSVFSTNGNFDAGTVYVYASA